MATDARRVIGLLLVLLLVVPAATGQPAPASPASSDHTVDPVEPASSDQAVRLNLTATPSGDVRVTVTNVAADAIRGLVVTIRITEGRPTATGSTDVPGGTTLSTADWPTPRKETTPVRLVWTLETLDSNASQTLSVTDTAEPRLGTAGSVARLVFEATGTVEANTTGARQRVGTDRVVAERERDPFYVDAPPSPTATPTPTPTPTPTDRSTSTTTPGFDAGVAVLAALVALVASRVTRER